jgi:hypothetical protein
MIIEYMSLGNLLQFLRNLEEQSNLITEQLEDLTYIAVQVLNITLTLTLHSFPCFSSFYLCVLSYYVSLRSEFRFMMSVTISAYILFSVRLYLQLFIGVRMSYLCYLCLFSYNGVQHILCCVLALLFVVLCTLSCRFLWIVHL